MTKNIIKPDPVCSIQEKGVFQGIEREGGGEKEGIEGTAVGIEGMLGRGGSPLGNVVGSGGSAPGFGRLGKDGNGGKEKGIGGIAVGIVGTEGMLGRGGSPVGNVVGSGGSAPGHENDGRDGVGRLGKDGKLCVRGCCRR
ncbi:hypothetical protein V6Z11_D13G059000 [Gossypium hirsutum]